MLDSIKHAWVFLNIRARYGKALLDTGKMTVGTHMPVLMPPSGAEPATRVWVLGYL